MTIDAGTSPSHYDLWSALGVVVTRDRGLLSYPELAQVPFDPDTNYPEYDGPVSTTANRVYRAVRETLRLLGRDTQRYGTPTWNPLRGIIEPGMRVVLKPNWVADCVEPHADLIALFTHMSVIRPIIDYVRIALRDNGSIVLGDAPIQRTNWQNLLQVGGIGPTVEALNDGGHIPIDLVDFRYEVTMRDRYGVAVERDIRDASAHRDVDLGTGSTLMPIIHDYKKFRVSQYDPGVLQRNHNHERNCYMIHRSVLEADVVVNLPKMKVHKKAGITCAMKNLVGINTRKDCLAHHRLGDRETGGGDEFPYRSRIRGLHAKMCDAMETGLRAKRRVASIVARGTRGLLKLRRDGNCYEGNWYGNDTTWRMVHDLNLVMCYASKTGQMADQVQRRALHFVDGIIGGEGDSPLQPTAHPAGVLLAGTNPVAMDIVAATLMGLAPQKIPLLRHAWDAPSAWQLPPEEGQADQIRVHIEDGDRSDSLELRQFADRVNLCFEPPLGWAGNIERNQVRAV